MKQVAGHSGCWGMGVGVGDAVKNLYEGQIIELLLLEKKKNQYTKRQGRNFLKIQVKKI